MKYGKPPKKEEKDFDNYIEDLHNEITSVQDPGEADAENIVEKFNNLRIELIKRGIMR